jgi:hypothetical protein
MGRLLLVLLVISRQNMLLTVSIVLLPLSVDIVPNF